MFLVISFYSYNKNDFVFVPNIKTLIQKLSAKDK